MHKTIYKTFNDLKEFAQERGITLFGVCCFDKADARLLGGENSVREGLIRRGVEDRRSNTACEAFGEKGNVRGERGNPHGTYLEDYPLAISMGLRLSVGVLNTLIERPTKLYLWHYCQANVFLDRIAFELSLRIQAVYRSRAVPIAASQVIDWEKMCGHLSHKHVGLASGLGYIGKNNLLVNPQYGAQLRYVTVLTDLELPVTESVIPSVCDKCGRCIDHCPAGAIKEQPEDFDHLACLEMLKTFTQKSDAGQYICGICQKYCWGDS